MSRHRVEIEELVKIPFLAGLPPSELEALISAGRLVMAGAGDLLFSAGEGGSELCLLLDGEVAIELAVDGAPPRVLATLASGTVFGEVSFLLGSERTAAARALRPTRVLALSRDGLERASEQGPLASLSVIEAVARILALRLSNVDRDLAEICSRIRKEHPDAAHLLESVEERRRRLHQLSSF